MSRILIVEDEAQIARFVELELRHEGYETDKAQDGRSGLDMALEQDYDLLLLDVMLPGLNGIEVLRRLRLKKNTPVILLTARDAVMDKVSGLDAGANDYVTKPFAIEELLARVRACLRQSAAGAGEAGGASGAAAGKILCARAVVENLEKFLDTGAVISKESADKEEPSCDVCLDEDRHEVTVGGVPVELTGHEFDLLKTLLTNLEIVMSREKLISAVCGYDYLGETNVIDVYVRYLRVKIDERFSVRLIRTVRGVGYVIRQH